MITLSINEIYIIKLTSALHQDIELLIKVPLYTSTGRIHVTNKFPLINYRNC